MFEELYEDYLSHLKIRRLVKASLDMVRTSRDGEDREQPITQQQLCDTH